MCHGGFKVLGLVLGFRSILWLCLTRLDAHESGFLQGDIREETGVRVVVFLETAVNESALFRKIEDL